MIGDIVQGAECIAVTEEKYPDGSYKYIYKCPYCENTFKATNGRIRGGQDNCGCQIFKRRGHRKGIESPLKKNDYDKTVIDVRKVYVQGAKARGHCFDLKDSDIASLIFSSCHYCGNEPSLIRKIGYPGYPRESLPTGGIDRRDNNLGYTLENCVPCCLTCNYMKKAKSSEDFLSHILKIYNNTFKRLDNGTI